MHDAVEPTCWSPPRAEPLFRRVPLRVWPFPGCRCSCCSAEAAAGGAADPAVPMASGFSVQFRVRRWIGGDVAGAGSGLGSYLFCDLADPTLAAQHTEPQLTNLVAQDKVTDGFSSSQLASRLPGGHEVPCDAQTSSGSAFHYTSSHSQRAGSVTHAAHIRVDSICTGGSIACWGATIDITRVVQCS